MRSVNAHRARHTEHQCRPAISQTRILSWGVSMRKTSRLASELSTGCCVAVWPDMSHALGLLPAGATRSALTGINMALTVPTYMCDANG